MNNDNTLIPNYRFPEFKNDGSWNKLKVEEIIMNESSSLSINKLEFLDNGYKLFGADGLVGYIDSYKQKDDYIAIVKDGSGAGRLSYYPAYSSVVGTLTYLKIKDKKLNDLKFQYYNLHNIDFKNHIKGGGIPHIYYSDYKNDLIGNPTNPSEQQKIAACLSSLDDVIAGHKEKLTLLEEHKKGLMQNLFPQEGETQPKYRFPEFENDGDWDVRELESISLNIMVGIASAATHAYRSSGIVLFRNQNIKSGYLDDSDILFIEEEYEKSHKNKRLKAGDLLTARTGYPGTTCVVPEEYEGSQSFTTLITRPDKKIINSYFLSYYINSDIGQEFFETKKIGGGQKNVNATTLAKMPILFPNLNEQQKIASILSSVDELIVAQREKIEALKAHKKGLMQGLFPKIES